MNIKASDVNELVVLGGFRSFLVLALTDELNRREYQIHVFNSFFRSILKYKLVMPISNYFSVEMLISLCIPLLLGIWSFPGEEGEEVEELCMKFQGMEGE